MSEKSAYNTSKAASAELVDSLLEGSFLNYVGHRACIRKSILAARREKIHVNLGDLLSQNNLAGGQERNHLHRETWNGVWLSAVHHRLNGNELSQEESRDNLCLRYGLMLQVIPATCDGCGKKLSIKHALSCPNDGFVLLRYDEATMERGALGSWALVPSAITYKLKINSRTVQGERTEAGAQQDGGADEYGTDTLGEAQGGNGRTVNGAARLVGQLG